MGQEQYDLWVQTTTPNQQDSLCGGNQISENEKYFIDKYASSIIIDIGCGTGHRTFPEWTRRQLNFYGFEKFQNLIEDSRYRDKIILADIANVNFKDKINAILENKISIAFLLGGVINGIIEGQGQNNTWGNFTYLLDKCKYILIDTLTHFSWYNSADSGKKEQLFHLVPTQYFYSKKEIEILNNKYNIEICEERTENIGHLKRTHYLLRRKKK